METRNEGYKDYLITVVPKYKRGTNIFGIAITITRTVGGKPKDRTFVPEDQFVNEQEALDKGVELGKGIIDGAFPNYTVNF